MYISYKSVQYVCIYRIYVNAMDLKFQALCPVKLHNFESPGWHRKVGPVDASECPTIPARHSPSQGISSSNQI